MTIKVSKPSINLREKLNELDFDRVPFQKMPAGSVVQTVTASISAGLTATNTAGGQSVLYGLTANRVYVDLASITITPQSSSNTLLVFSNVGMQALTRSNKGAWGCSLVKDNTTGYLRSNYPYYAADNMPHYAPDITQHWAITSGSTASATYYLKGFAYNEPSPSAAQTFRTNPGQFTIMEVAS